MLKKIYMCEICKNKPDQISHHKTHLDTQKHKDKKELFELKLSKLSSNELQKLYNTTDMLIIVDENETNTYGRIGDNKKMINNTFNVYMENRYKHFTAFSKSSIISCINHSLHIEKEKIFNLYKSLYSLVKSYRDAKNIVLPENKKQDYQRIRNDIRIDIDNNIDYVNTVNESYNDKFKYNQGYKDQIATILSYPVHHAPGDEDKLYKYHQYIYGMFLLSNFAYLGSRFKY